MAITKGCMDTFQGPWHEIEQEVPRFALKRPVWVNCRGLGSTLSKFTNLNEQSSLLTQQVGDIHGDRFSDFKYSRVTRRTRWCDRIDLVTRVDGFWWFSCMGSPAPIGGRLTSPSDLKGRALQCCLLSSSHPPLFCGSYRTLAAPLPLLWRTLLPACLLVLLHLFLICALVWVSHVMLMTHLVCQMETFSLCGCETDTLNNSQADEQKKHVDRWAGSFSACWK